MRAPDCHYVYHSVSGNCSGRLKVNRSEQPTELTLYFFNRHGGWWSTSSQRAVVVTFSFVEKLREEQLRFLHQRMRWVQRSLSDSNGMAKKIRWHLAAACVTQLAD